MATMNDAEIALLGNLGREADCPDCAKGKAGQPCSEWGSVRAVPHLRRIYVAGVAAAKERDALRRRAEAAEARVRELEEEKMDAHIEGDLRD